MKTSQKFLLTVVGVAAALLAGSPVRAAQQTIFGLHFDLTYDDTLLGLFGTPSLLGDTVVFTPSSFKAESNNNLGDVTANSTINLRIVAHAGQQLTGLNLLEQGDYLLRGPNSLVSVTGQLRSFGLSKPLTQLVNTITPTPTTDLTVADASSHDWAAAAQLNYVAANLDASTGVNVTIENLLEAYTDAADPGNRRAFIEKKFTGDAVALTVSVVPEPMTGVLLAAGLVGVAYVGVSRRRRQR